MPLLASTAASEALYLQILTENLKALLNLDSHENQALMERYLTFLNHHEIARSRK